MLKFARCPTLADMLKNPNAYRGACGDLCAGALRLRRKNSRTSRLPVAGQSPQRARQIVAEHLSKAAAREETTPKPPAPPPVPPQPPAPPQPVAHMQHLPPAPQLDLPAKPPTPKLRAEQTDPHAPGGRPTNTIGCIAQGDFAAG